MVANRESQGALKGGFEVTCLRPPTAQKIQFRAGTQAAHYSPFRGAYFAGGIQQASGERGPPRCAGAANALVSIG